MSRSTKKPIKIRFRYNKESGQIEDLIVDDNAPNASEDFHDQVAGLIAGQLGVNVVIEDAGTRFTSQTIRGSVKGELAAQNSAMDKDIEEE